MDFSYAILTLKVAGENKEFKVIYDRPLVISNVKMAFQRWIEGEGDDDEFTADSLVHYLRQQFSEIHFFTEEQFENLLKTYDLNVKPLDPSDN